MPRFNHSNNLKPLQKSVLLFIYVFLSKCHTCRKSSFFFLLDEEHLFGVSEGSEVPEAIASSGEYQSWEQFATVATNLLEKIEQFLESLQGLDEE